MRRVRPSTAAGVSLFPFLAVLLCTMGALIVVLIVITRQAQAQAQAAIAETLADSAEDRHAAQELLDFRIEQLRMQREKTQADLAQRRFVLGQVEDHWRQLESKLVELRRAYDELENVQALDLSQRDARRQELERLKQQVAVAEQQLAAARRMAATRPPAYAVVPYDGPSGTRRRPIYIECRNDAVVIQPEGVRLAVGDFVGPLGPSNALASGVRAVREYMAAQQKNEPAPREPYPLLLVRPDGIEAYYVARLALQDWDTEFGYEMIEADWPLEFPPADDALRDIVQQAVDDARVRQRILAQHAPRQFGESRSRSFRAAPGGGVVEAEGPASGGAGLRSGAATFGDGRRGSGFARGEQPGGMGGAQRGGGSDYSGETEVAELPYASGLAGDSPAGDSLAGDLKSGNGQSLASGGGRTGTGAASADGSNASEPSLRGSGGGFGRSLRGDSNNRDGAGQGSTFAGSVARSGATGGMAAPAASSGMTASGAGSAGDPTSGQVGVGTPSIDFSRGQSTQSLAQARGKDWGIPESVRGATPVSRPIRLECRGDRFVILGSQSGVRGRREIMAPSGAEPAVDELVLAVWDEVQAWGIAGQGMYWHPTLTCDVTPDGQQRFAELQQLLAESGLEVKARGTAAQRVAQPLSAPRR